MDRNKDTPEEEKIVRMGCWGALKVCPQAVRDSLNKMKDKTNDDLQLNAEAFSTCETQSTS